MREKDSETKNEISGKYKLYRNMIVTLPKMSKKNYYSAFFLQNQGNVKKTWDGIRALIKNNKKMTFLLALVPHWKKKYLNPRKLSIPIWVNLMTKAYF